MSKPKGGPKGWKDLPIGGMIVEAGNAATYNTGAWRSERPIWIEENCIQCLFCWIYCPDSSVTTKEGKRSEFDYMHCKGCGVCAMECPAKVKAIVMVPEAEGAEPDILEKAKAIAKKMAEEKAAEKEKKNA
jgi:pyruvate ferredoxin oxidoreductase delta subunit